MRHEEYHNHVHAFVAEMAEVTSKKNPDYSMNQDAMNNFKAIATMLGNGSITPRIVWAVLMGKHLTAIMSHMAQGKSLKDETIHGRFIDLANYAMLGDALDKDLASPPENAEPDRLVVCPIRSGWVDMLVEAANHFKFEGGFSRLEFNTRKMAKEMQEFLDDVNHGSENPDGVVPSDSPSVQRSAEDGRPDREPKPRPDFEPSPGRVTERPGDFRGY